MAGSYNRINYRLRPAKSAERKMIIETLRRLTPFGRVADYRYVGMGSPYFVDFALMHKLLGLTNLVNIERDQHNADRFEFNKPFDCIDMHYGEATNVLAYLTWDNRSIVWLDYDGLLEPSVLSDVSHVCSVASPGSVLLVTVNAEKPDATENEDRVSTLRNRLGADRMPQGLVPSDFAGWRAADVYRRILKNQIEESLVTRNGPLSANNHMHFKQLINFVYKDGARMLTLGGLLYKSGQENLVQEAEFSQLSFVKSAAESYRIEMPNLTPKEVRHLDSLLPTQDIEKLCQNVPVPAGDAEKYANIYRYFPSFSEIEN